MRTGISYMGHHNPKHMKVDFLDIKQLGCDDVFLAAQENDFVYMTGKVDFLPEIAKDLGIKPHMILWGVLNYFGGGKSSQFLLDNPRAHQVQKDGSYNAAGCYNNPDCIAYIKKLIDVSVEKGYEGYFIDEPSLIDCYCDSCRKLFQQYGGFDLLTATDEQLKKFREHCIVGYVRNITEYIKQGYSQVETMCCVMPQDKSVWEPVAALPHLDSIGTDIYWVNEDNNVNEMIPMLNDMTQLCKVHNKKQHQWLQAWGVSNGKEQRIIEQGDILLKEKLNALYVWAYQGQLGTSESCDDPKAVWNAACEILRKAKNQ